MAKYDLLLNVIATGASGMPQGQAVSPPGPTNPNMPPQQQSFQLDVVGVGAVSATAQLLVSNDDGPDPSLYNWTPYNDPFTAAGTNSGNNIQGGTQCWKNFAAYLTAISGTNASAILRMSA